MNKILPLLFCLLFVQKSFSQCTTTVDAGPDLTICNPPSPVQIEGSASGSYTSVTWTPLAGLSGANSLTPIANVSQTTTYIVTLRAPNLDVNLIQNFDFSQGTASFSSDYQYVPGNLWNEGTYDVTNDPSAVHPNFAPCNDHSGDGNMMVINGAGVTGVNVYCQSVPVNANTEYIFSAWACSVIPTSPAILQFSVNGVLLGSTFGVPGGTCGWANFTTIWQSGGNTTADICIVNQNTAFSGNDFALDDFGFYEICKPKDSVTVHVVNVKAVAAPFVVNQPCESAPINLNGTGSTTGPNISYLWTTSGGNIVSGETTLNPVVNATGEYTLTVSYDDGNGTFCEKTATVTVNPNPVPVAAIINQPPPLGCSNPTATLAAAPNQSGNYTYHWETTDGNILSGQNNPACQINQAGTYSVTLTNSVNGCTGTGQVTVTSNGQIPLANAAAGNLNCTNPTTTLSGAGSSSGNPFTYNWLAQNGGQISGSTTNQDATAAAAGTYILTVTNPVNGCSARDTVIVLANISAPLATILPQGTIDCITDTLTLESTASPANSTFSWSGSNGGNIVAGAATAFPKVTTTGNYTLIITNPANGCRDTAAVTVLQDLQIPPVSIATPGIIDCQNSSVTLSGSIPSGNNFSFIWTTVGGNFSANQNTLNPTVNAAGNYILTVQNAQNGCSNSANVTVLKDQNAVTAVANTSQPITCTTLISNLNSTGSSSGSGLVYLWTPVSPGAILNSGNDQPTAVAGAPGIYQLQISNPANGCTATDLAEVLENKTPPSVSVLPGGTVGCVPVNLTLSASSVPNATFSWVAAPGGNIISGGTSATPIVNAAGNYLVTVTDPANGCTATNLATVLEDETPPPVSVLPGGTIGCTPTNLTLSASSVPNATFSWAAAPGGNIVSGATSASPIVNAAGNYMVTATDPASGCTATATTTVLTDASVPKLTYIVPDTLTCVKNSITIWSASNLMDLDFLWTSASGAGIYAGANFSNPAIILPGNYTLLATNPANQCTATLTVSVFENKKLPPAEAGLPQTLTCFFPEFSLNANANQAPGNYNFAWSGAGIVSGQNSQIAKVNKPGTYILTVTDPANGCTATDDVLISENKEVPVLTLAPADTLTCENVQVQLSASCNSFSGPVGFQWLTTNGNIISGSNSSGCTVNLLGEYTAFSIGFANGCADTASILVFQNVNLPAVEAGIPQTLTCTKTTANLAATADSGSGISYLWTTSNGQLLSGANTLTPEIGLPGTYFLQVSNSATGCTGSDFVEILENKNPPISAAGPNDTLNCGISFLNLTGAGSSPGGQFSYFWTTQNGLLGGNPNSLNPTANAPGTYKIVVTDNQNGCTSTAETTIFKDENAPLAAAGLPDTLTCDVLQTTLSGNISPGADIIFNWTTTNGNIFSGGNTLSPTVDKPGIYILKVTNTANGCTALSSVSIALNDVKPTVDAGTSNDLTCSKPTISLTGTGNAGGQNLSISWSSPTGGIVSGATTLTPKIDKPGTYFIQIKNLKNGCENSDFVAVKIDTAAPKITIATPDTLTCSQPGVLILADFQPNTVNFTNLWTTSGTGHIVTDPKNISPLVDKPGTYFLEVKNLTNGCTSTAQVAVFQNITPPIVNAGTTFEITCDQPMVTLSGTASGGSNLIFDWTTSGGGFIVNGKNTLSPTVSKSGNYNLNATNPTNGCTASDAVLVSENTTPPDVSIAAPGLLTCLKKSVLLVGSASLPGGGAGSFQPVWSSPSGHFLSGQNVPTVEVDQPGTYILTVENQQNGCISTANVVVLESINLPNVDAGQPQILHCNRPTAALEGTSTTAGNLQFDWTSPDGKFASPTNVSAPSAASPGIYFLKITNPANGCTATDSVSVSEIENPIFEFDLTHPDCKNPTGIAEITSLSGGLLPYEFSVGGAFSVDPFFENLAPGNYDLVIRDANGCTVLRTISINEPVKPSLEIPKVDAIFLGDSVLLRPQFSTPNSTVAAWFWSPAEGLSCVDCEKPWAKPLVTSNYLLTIQDANGCTAQARVLVKVDKQRLVYVPNIFSPNDDGVNDEFLIYGKGILKINKLQIFDRWGEQVFVNSDLQPNDPRAGWGGDFREKNVAPAVFVWWAEILFLDGEVEFFKGDVTLER